MIDDETVTDSGDAAANAAEDVSLTDAAPESDTPTETAEPAADHTDAVVDEPAVEPKRELTAEELEFTDDEIVTDDELDPYGDDNEDASPIEEFVEEVKPQETDADKEWYILKVQVNRENSVCDALKRGVKKAGMEDLFGEVLVPTEDIREFNKAGKQRIVKRKLYPGYIVVNMAINDDSWFLVRDTSGIGDFAGASGRPAPLSEEEIKRIIAATRPEEVEDDEEQIKTAIPFKIGDRVRVKEGYFQNYEGDVSTIDERNGRIEVMINIFGRPNPVDIDHWHVEMVQ